MFRVEFVNVFTQEILREVPYQDEKAILEIIDMLSSKPENSNDTYLIDSQFRSLDAEYVSHSKLEDDGVTVYKLFFKVQLSEKQLKLQN
ncbi:hypothetical protein V7201_02180 [Bacillus sp. JJ1122]|uniref:hypothetical protein n=1 Tax=Bacillus sp. JJ1122 TaxID=3122951 RepID=UPI002FFF1031